MSETQRSQFEQAILVSGLLTEQQLDEARSGGRWSEGEESSPPGPPTDEQLGERLVELGWLNPWQIKQLQEGRTKFNLGPYWIVDSIGQGGMGQVFMAEHSVMGRVVAIKVLPLSKSTPAAIENFTREIRALASLDHARLVQAMDAGYDGNVYYLVTEYVPGCDLRKLVRREGPLSMQSAATIIYQVAEGLHHAHSQGIIHRDVKPGNVLVAPEGEAKLSDLGLAGSLDADAQSDPRFGKIVGTADYLSPDHIESPWDPTPAWDIYSLGCTLYYAATGKVPFPGGTTSDKARAQCELRPLDPRRLNSQLSDEFVDVLADMMAKDPAQRIPSAAAVMSRLLPWVDRAILSPALPAVEGGVSPRPTASPIVAPPMAAPPPIPPRIATPPGAHSRTARAPMPRVPMARAPMAGAASQADRASLTDTQPELPEIPPSTPDEDDSASVEVPVPIEAPRRSSFSSKEIDLDLPPVSITRPLLVLVLLPLLLIATVMVIWLLLQSVLGG